MTHVQEQTRPIAGSATATELRNQWLPRRVMLILQSTSVGGMETHCVDVGAELVHRGAEVMAIIPEPDTFDNLGLRFARTGATVCRLNTDGLLGRGRQAVNWLALVKTCRRWRPDVVHVHTGGATGGLAPVLAGRWAARAATVITEHDVPGEFPGRQQRLARWAMDRLVHAIIAVSRRNARLRAERLRTPRYKVASILNGVPIAGGPIESRELNRGNVRAELGIGADETVLGSLVRLAEGKGLDDLLRAFAIAARASNVPDDGEPGGGGGSARPVPRPKLLLVGDGPLRFRLEALAAELAIADDVRFAGHQAQPAAYLDAMDAFALAVPAGSMSVALLEAMARGLPPVITFCGPEEPVLDVETGLCAPPSDPTGLAGVLRRLLTDTELRERLGRGAALHTRRYFSIRRVVDDLVEVYAGCRRAVPARLRADQEPSHPQQCTASDSGAM